MCPSNYRFFSKYRMFINRPSSVEKLTVVIFKITEETNTDDL